MAAGSKFPLLHLPDKEILRTIRFMGIYQKVSFSLISKRCKRLIQSLQIKAAFISVSINNDIRMFVALPGFNLQIYFENSTMRNEGQKKILGAPLTVSFHFTHRLERIGFKYSDWLDHFQTVFHCPSIDNIQFYYGSSEYDLDEIREVFGTIKKLYARDTGCYANNLMLFQKFSTIEKLNFNPHMFEGSKIPLSILQQNYDFLDIESYNNNATEMTLNELLVINSNRITIAKVRIPPQDLNKFIKLWIQGSSSRMEYLNIFRTDGFQYDRAVVMKGIKHSTEQIVELDVRRVSMNICRMDGTCATILFAVGWVQMLVWIA